jgi:hypothetical protein
MNRCDPVRRRQTAWLRGMALLPWVLLLAASLGSCVGQAQRLDARWERFEADAEFARACASAELELRVAAARAEGDEAELGRISNAQAQPLARVTFLCAMGALAYLQCDLRGLERAHAGLETCLGDIEGNADRSDVRARRG